MQLKMTSGVILLRFILFVMMTLAYCEGDPSAEADAEADASLNIIQHVIKPPPPECIIDSDCSGLYATCNTQLGKCIPPECVVDADCFTQYATCNLGTCIPPECVVDGECSETFATCNLGLCVSPECVVDDECSEEFATCNLGTCVPPDCTTNVDCNVASGEVCESGVCVIPPECLTDTDCTELGTFCDTTLGECLTKASFDDECVATSQCPNADDYQCTGSKCVCSSAAVYKVGSGCIAKKNLDEACDEDIQCEEAVSNSECGDSSACACKSDFQLNADEDACVPEMITSTLTMDSEDAWNANYAVAGSTEYNDLSATWNTILTGDSSISSTSNFVFTENTAVTTVTVDVEMLNPDKAAQKKRRAQEELIKEISDNGPLMNSLVKRGISEPQSQTSASIHAMLDDGIDLRGFCLQNVDCLEVGTFCFMNMCDTFQGRYWY